MTPEFQKEWNALYLLRYGLSMLVHLLVIILLAYGIVWACSSAYIFCYEIFGPVVAEEAPGQDINFTVQEDDTMWEVARNLESSGIIVNKYSFFIRMRLMNSGNMVMHVGDYMLNTSMDYETIIETLTYTA